MGGGRKGPLVAPKPPGGCPPDQLAPSALLAPPAQGHAAAVRAFAAVPSVVRVLRYRSFIEKDTLSAVRLIERGPS